MSDRLCSKDVADLMEKRHDNLMRTIRKEHNTYHGEKQTILTRCNIVEAA